jgi:hypothetical protein
MKTENYTTWIDANGKTHTAAGHLKPETLRRKGAQSARHGLTIGGRIDWERSDIGAVNLEEVQS